MCYGLDFTDTARKTLTRQGTAFINGIPTSILRTSDNEM